MKAGVALEGNKAGEKNVYRLGSCLVSFLGFFGDMTSHVTSSILC